MSYHFIYLLLNSAAWFRRTANSMINYQNFSSPIISLSHNVDLLSFFYTLKRIRWFLEVTINFIVHIHCLIFILHSFSMSFALIFLTILRNICLSSYKNIKDSRLLTPIIIYSSCDERQNLILENIFNISMMFFHITVCRFA